MLKNTALTFSISKSINIIILLAFILTPIFTIKESMALIFGGIISQTEIATPIYIKLLKDLMFIMLILFSILGIFYSKRILKINIFLILYIIFLLLIAYLFKNDLIIFFSGIRWLIPFMLMLLLIPYITKELIIKISYIGFYLFIFHFSIQLFQLFFAGAWFGLNAFGLSARNPGIFFIPSTSAFFTILILFLNMFYMDDQKIKRFIFILSPISVFLTASGSGVVVYMVIVLLYLLKKRYMSLLPILGIVLFLIVFLTLEDIVGRKDFIELSFGVRIMIFLELLQNSDLFSSNFGYATNTGVLIGSFSGVENAAFVADSTYASILGNLGLFTFILVMLFIFLSLFLAWLQKDREKLIFILIYFLFSATTIIFEAYPMNLLFSILMAYYLRNYKNERTYETPNNPQ